MRKLLSWTSLLISLMACAPVVEVHKVGNEYVQHAYSRNWWWPNWNRTVFCADTERNGYCAKEDRRVETVTATAQESWGQGASKAALTGVVGFATFGALMNDGLKNQNVARMTQSVGGLAQEFRTSTLLLNGPVPGGVAR
jgi:hypothetical protein